MKIWYIGAVLKIKPNEGKKDRVIRTVVGAVLFFFGWMWLIGVPQVLAMAVGGALVITGLTGFCSLYALLGINTCPRK